MNNNIRLLITFAAVCTAMISSSAIACPDDEQERHVIQNFVFSPDGENHTFSTSKSIEIREINGKLTVVIDGKEIPSDRINRVGGKIKILDDDGNELPMLGVTLGAGKAGKGKLFNLRQIMGEDNDPHTMIQWFGGDFTPPKVMLGVQLSQTSKALEYHLGLDAGTTTMLTEVFENLGAAEAGLEKYDIIVSINGQTPADPQSIRQTLADKEPGDEITLSVIHQGKKRKANVQLEKYDCKSFSTFSFGFGEDLPFAQRGILEFEMDGNLKGLHKILIDPDNGNFFRELHDGAKDFQFKFNEELLEKLGEDFGDDVILKMHEHLSNQDESKEARTQAIHKHIEKLQKILDDLVQQAKTIEDNNSDI